MGGLRWLLGFVLVFGVINLALWGGQELYYRDDTKKIKEVEAWLETERQAIEHLEAKVASEKSELERLGKELDRYEAMGYITAYNAGVPGFNRLVGVHRLDVAAYNSRIDAYNAKVSEINALIERAGSRWYLIPLPRGKTMKSKLPPRL